MSELHITNIPENLRQRVINHLNKKDGGYKKGDLRKFAIKAMEMWLDTTTPKDRGHTLLQKEIDELTTENRRLKACICELSDKLSFVDADGNL